MIYNVSMVMAVEIGNKCSSICGLLNCQQHKDDSMWRNPEQDLKCPDRYLAVPCRYLAAH
jgi:hypothetical protein